MHHMFIEHKPELDSLEALYKNKGSGLVVIKGRRRIRKSRLVSEFAKRYKDRTFWSFVGLALMKE